MLSTSEFTQHHEAGTLRVIGTFTDAPSPFIKNVPLLKEQGIDLAAEGWYAFYGPAKMPRDLVMQLNKVINDMANEPATKQKFLAMGVAAAGTTPEDLTRVQRRDKEFWGPIVKRSGWKPDL
jgi:tripartite-type tricarboxylate transporter receptor subunit TctC